MKKIILGFGVCFLLLATSCRKDWVCVCTYDQNEGDDTYTSESDFKGHTEDEATKGCDNLEGTSYNGQTTYEVTCEIEPAE